MAEAEKSAESYAKQMRSTREAFHWWHTIERQKRVFSTSIPSTIISSGDVTKQILESFLLEKNIYKIFRPPWQNCDRSRDQGDGGRKKWILCV